MAQGVAHDQTKLVIAKDGTGNKKTGPVAITYASQGSCPNSCPFYGNGCYAEEGPMGLISKRLNRAAAQRQATPEDIALEEAEAISKLAGILPLRLHAVGDCRTEEAARIVSAAADQYARRARQPVWSYTHAWRVVPRAAWGGVSILASCETLKAVQRAQERGYATAMVVDEHPEDGRATVVDGQRLIPCPQQTGKAASCATCRLCWNAEALRERNATITFAAHGTRKKAAKQVVSALVESARI